MTQKKSTRRKQNRSKNFYEDGRPLKKNVERKRFHFSQKDIRDLSSLNEEME